MEIRKAADVLASGKPDEKQLAEINKLTRSPLKAEEVYVFSVRLCDDRVDRDFERFHPDAVKALAPMFVGKTGILDHDWSAENQLGRIFATQIMEQAGTTWLKAWVYMLRSEKTAQLIREIEGGIKKEVSVGCAVSRTVCSVCGEDYGDCEHRKGETYGGKLCTAVLCDPADAYEFSFVAVPAQKEAGVVKTAEKSERRLRQLEKEAEYGRIYRASLRKEVVKLGLLLELGVEEKTLRKMAASLDMEELAAVRDAFAQKTDKLYPPLLQLGKTVREKTEKPDSAFMI